MLSLFDAKGNLKLIFEAVAAGTGSLKVHIKNLSTGTSEISFLPMEMQDIKNFYEHYTVGDTDTQGATILQSSVNINPLDYRVDRGLSETDDYILFVHGWRMQPWERRAFAETAFKRLYWSGYKGKFGFFSWPTEYVSDNSIWYEPQNYTRSEAVARRSAQAFANRTLDLGGMFNLNVFAHSMGNYVVSEALKRNNTTINTYVATQAATEAESYAPYDVYTNEMKVNHPLQTIYDATTFLGIPVARPITSNPIDFYTAWHDANASIGNTNNIIPPDLFAHTPNNLLDIGDPHTGNTALPYPLCQDSCHLLKKSLTNQSGQIKRGYNGTLFEEI